MVSPRLAGASLWTHPTPLPSLRPANLQPAAEAVEVGRLILKAAEWSPQSHELFPEAARKRAVEVMRLGYLIAWDEERFEGREGAAPELADVWRGFVLPRVVALGRRRAARLIFLLFKGQSRLSQKGLFSRF